MSFLNTTVRAVQINILTGIFQNKVVIISQKGVHVDRKLQLGILQCHKMVMDGYLQKLLESQ